MHDIALFPQPLKCPVHSFFFLAFHAVLLATTSRKHRAVVLIPLGVRFTAGTTLGVGKLKITQSRVQKSNAFRTLFH